MGWCSRHGPEVQTDRVAAVMSQATLMLTALAYPGVETTDLSNPKDVRQIVSWLESRKVIVLALCLLIKEEFRLRLDFAPYYYRSGNTSQNRGKQA